MTDIEVGILEPNSPSKLVDNELQVNSNNNNVVRQKVATPDASQLLFEILQCLEILKSNAATPDPTTGRTRVLIEAGTLPTVTTVGTVGTVSTVSTVSNVSEVGGYFTNLQEYNRSALLAYSLRDKITVA